MAPGALHLPEYEQVPASGAQHDEDIALSAASTAPERRLLKRVIATALTVGAVLGCVALVAAFPRQWGAALASPRVKRLGRTALFEAQDAYPEDGMMADTSLDRLPRSHQEHYASTGADANSYSEEADDSFNSGGTSSGSHNMAHEHSKPRKVSIRWSRHENKCVDVTGGYNQNGNVIQLWECNHSHPDMHFIIPADGKGPIQWAPHPELCVDAPGGPGTNVMLWDCSTATPTNVLWELPEGGVGPIRVAGHDDWCLDIPDENPTNGNWLQVWKCGEPGEGMKDMNFTIEQVSKDCKWSEWDAWSPCSASCGGGYRKRSRYHVSEAEGPRGRPCVGQRSDSTDCGTQVCMDTLPPTDSLAPSPLEMGARSNKGLDKGGSVGPGPGALASISALVLLALSLR
mmetsp:Transcript_46769/g.99955  ORF Transcript_46769/g.99955 Transcript_46769/m.99955 type:complete len:401 (+) Transcript_46769:171-1373(+)